MTDIQKYAKGTLHKTQEDRNIKRKGNGHMETNYKEKNVI